MLQTIKAFALPWLVLCQVAWCMYLPRRYHVSWIHFKHILYHADSAFLKSSKRLLYTSRDCLGCHLARRASLSLRGASHIEACKSISSSASPHRRNISRSIVRIAILLSANLLQVSHQGSVTGDSSSGGVLPGEMLRGDWTGGAEQLAYISGVERTLAVAR